MHSHEIIGWTFDGAMYCADHKPGGSEDEVSPIFAISEIEPLDYCDVCLHEWIGANPGKSVMLERASVYLDQERAEEFIRDEVLCAPFNRFEIFMRREVAEDCSHQGACDSDVDAYADEVRERNSNINPSDVRAELAEYGAWDEAELSDDEENWKRIVWCAACNLQEENFKND